LPPAYTLVSCSAYFSTMKMEATRRYIPEKSTLCNDRCEILKSFVGCVYRLTVWRMICVVLWYSACKTERLVPQSTAISLRDGQPENRDSILGEDEDVSFRHRAQTHLASCPMDTGDSFPWSKAVRT
jgi:hypothetical protein